MAEAVKGLGKKGNKDAPELKAIIDKIKEAHNLDSEILGGSSNKDGE